MTDPVGVTEDPRKVLMLGDEPEDDAAELIRLRGEAKVMRDLLSECATVLESIDTESTEEAEELTALLSSIGRALEAA